jgi:Icc-related predicted phosphoesterase
MVRIVALSDTHCKHKQVFIPDGDILIHAGDMTGLGKYNEFISMGNWFYKMKEKFKHRIIIAGNHDWGLMHQKELILDAHFDSDVIYLEDSGIELESIKFYGTPWMLEYYYWAFMRTEDELVKYYAAIPDDTEVLITHAPPFGILDKAMDGDKCGSRALYERIKQLPKLKHHIFGHIHESYGSETINGVGFHNVCSLNGNYRYQNPPAVIDI